MLLHAKTPFLMHVPAEPVDPDPATASRLPAHPRAAGWALALPVGATLGVVVGYLLDPDRGRARRRKLADQATARLRRQERRALAQVRYRRGRLRGTVLHLVGAGNAEPVDDIEVKQQVHRVLRSAGLSPHDITVEVSDRIAVLRGQAPSREQIDAIGRLVERVPGVHAVRNLLHAPGEPAPNKIDALRLSHHTG